MSTIDKALDALFLLGERPAPQRLSDLARDLGMPRSSAHRVLQPLLRRGLVEQETDGRYRVGLALMALGLGAAAREPLAVAARPVLEAAAAALGETFFLVVARAGQLVVIEKAEGTGFMRAAPQLGATVPVHATAVGKLFLAFDESAVLLPRLTRYTAATPTTRKALSAAVNNVREQGWAINDEEWQAGLSVVAAPVFVGGRIAGAVALAMVAARFHDLGQDAMLRRVRHAAEGVALRLEGGSV